MDRNCYYTENDCGMVQGEETTPRNCGDFENRCNMELSRAYVLSQPFRNLYDENTAICHGTLFKDLDKPYMGAK